MGSIVTPRLIILAITILGRWHQQQYSHRCVVTCFQPTRQSSFPNHRPMISQLVGTTTDTSWQSSLHRRLIADDGWQPKRLQSMLLFGMGDEDITLGNVHDKNNPRTARPDADASNNATKKIAGGVVVRLAARPFHADSSKPSSRSYTTQKVELDSNANDGVRITKDGVQGDYNHYRTVALKSTQDRAVSLLTTDVLVALRSKYPNFDIKDGDLGENILVDGVSFDFFKVGKRYQFVVEEGNGESPSSQSYQTSSGGGGGSSSSTSVIVEISETMEPCANLCKLPYINDDALEPKDRIARCKDFLQFLDRYDGFRGWYGKVIQEGKIPKGAKVVRLG